MNNLTALAAWAGLIVISLAWVCSLDWCVVRIIRAWKHRKITARMHDVLNGRD